MSEMVVKCVTENSVLDNITNILTLVVSVCNLGFIIWIYFKGKKDKKVSQEKEYKYDWFKMISINDRIENLSVLINDIKNKAEEIYKSEDDSTNERNSLMNERLNIINIAFFNEKNSFTYLLKCIDENSNKEISNLYNTFQEEYIDIFTKSVAKKEYSVDKLIEISSKISSKYYNIGIELIK